MTTIQDDRLRALMARLEEMTPPAPEFESLRGGSFEVRRPGVRTVIAIAAAMAIIIAGLVLIGTRRNDSSPADHRPLTTHSVATELPDGWEIKFARDGTGNRSDGLGEAQLFATDQAPAGPVVALLQTGEGSYGDDDSQSNVTLSDGRRAAIGSTYFTGARLLDVEAAPGQWVGVIARGISDDELLTIGAMVRIDGAGSSSFVGALPEGVVSVGTTALVGSVVTNDYGYSDPNARPIGSTFTLYGPAAGSTGAVISSFPARPVDNAVLGVVGQVTRVTTIGGEANGSTFAVDFGTGNDAGVYRIVDGLGFLARSSTLDAAQLLSMIDSLEAVDDTRWSGLVAQREDSEATPVETSAVESTLAPPPTYDTSQDEPTPVRIDYRVTTSEDGYVSMVDIPHGEVSITSRFVGRFVHLGASFNGKVLVNFAVDVSRGTGGTTLRPDDGSSLFVSISSGSNPAAELRVTAGGYVYSVPFITIDPSYPRIAMIVVPPGDGHTGPAVGYIYDSEGNVLDSAG